ncbi:MAG: rnd [Nevskia sp.]|nr:rnd [Nevskia sp.]
MRRYSRPAACPACRPLSSRNETLDIEAVNLITHPAALAAALDAWSGAPWLALDTEFVRETTYFPKLCLVQASDGRSAACIDTLALQAAELQPLLSALAASAADKIFHSASQDLEIFVQLTGDCPRPLFDTQIAAALLGDGDQLGYAALVEKRLGIKLDKSLTRTDWSRRPLSGAELSYAVDDVRYLAELYPLLLEELNKRERLSWLREDCQRATNPARYQTLPEQAWRRLKGFTRLAPPARPIAATLAAWREQTAQERDRPRKWILEDDAIYRIAERAPASLAQLVALNVLQPKTLERNGDTLLQLVASTDSSAAIAIDDALPFDDQQKACFKRVQDALRSAAEDLGLSVSLLGPRADAEAIVRHGAAATVPLMEGWRRAAIGEKLLALL